MVSAVERASSPTDSDPAGNPVDSCRVPLRVEEPGVPAPTDAEGAFSRYVIPEIQVLYRVAHSITRHDADAEDLVQDTMLRAFRSMDQFDGRHPRAWLLTIMRNAQINRVRRRRPGLLADPDDAGRGAPAIEAAPGPEQLAMDRRFDAVVEAAYRALPDRFREVIDLVDLGGLSYAEAAGVLDVPQGTVMSRLHRGRKRIREALADDGVQRGVRS
jgi:RNA polymerase sigma-70 factor (ECF subfamily)